MCGRLSRGMLTEVQREAQTSASCYAQLNTSILLHTSSLHHPELMTLLLLHKINSVQEYPEHGDKIKKMEGESGRLHQRAQICVFRLLLSSGQA